MDGSSIEFFWQWFTANEQSIFDLVALPEPNAIVEELALRLNQLDENLSYEIGPERKNRRDFVLSASGVRQSFGTVLALLEAAPASDFFDFIAYRQRKSLEGLELHLGNLRADINSIFCSLKQELRRIDVTLYVDNYVEDDYYAWMNAAFIILDTAIGEIDVGTKVGEVEVAPKHAVASSDCFSLAELAARFDRLVAEELKKISQFDKLPRLERHELLFKRVEEEAALRLAEMLANGAEAPERICLECYFRPLQPYSGEFVGWLEKLSNSAVTTVEMGGLDCERTWVLFSIEQEDCRPEAIQSTVRSLAERGLSFDCELEQVYLSEVMDDADILNLLSGIKLPSASLSALRAQQQMETGKFDEATELLEEALEDYPGDIELRGLLSYAYAKAGAVEEAEQMVDELAAELEAHEDFAATFWNIACSCALVERRSEACQFLEVALSLNPSLRDHVAGDPDLSRLAGLPEFDRLHTLQ